MLRDMRPLKYLVVAASLGLGALFATGCVLAALFEAQGFGGPRDQAPRTGYMIQLAFAFAACVAIPAFVSRRLLHVGPGWVTAAVVAVAGVLLILGLSFIAVLGRFSG
jgi:hypothetical protein